MADKEIIIDGVDVSKCSHYNPLGNYNCGGTKKCSQWSNCHFKQLARKTQEYEELKAYAQRQENQREEYYKEYLKLSQECEELKSESFTREELISIQEKDIARYCKALVDIENIVIKDYYDNSWVEITNKIDSIRSIINKNKKNMQS